MKYLIYLISFLLSFLYDIYYFFFGNIRSRLGGWNYYKYSKLYPDYLKLGNMTEAIKWGASPYCQGRGVDIGAGKWPLPGARAVEDNKEENAYKINEADASLDFVFSSHNLEHLRDWQSALREWHRVLKPSGFICLYLPHSAVAMWRPGVNKQHLWAPDLRVVMTFLVEELKMTTEKCTGVPDGFLSFYIIVKK